MYSSIWGSCTNESSQNLPMYAFGAIGLSMAQRSGRTSNPCCTRARVAGKDPPPCAKATRSLGRRSKTPPKIIEQMANELSAGIPTNQGNQYFVIFSFAIMSQG